MSDRDLLDLYRELILDHSRNPRHFGKLDPCTHESDGINPLCGDKLHLYLSIEDGKIDAASFEGTGCAISVASASLMTDAVIGMSIDEAQRYFTAITERLTQSGSDTPVIIDEKFEALDGVREYPARVKCATLAWHALHAAISGQNKPVTTE